MSVSQRFLQNRFRTALAFTHDVAASGVAWAAAFLLRFNLDIPPPYGAMLTDTVLWIVPVQVLLFWAFGLYRGIWRYASLPDLKRIVLAIGVAALTAPAIFTMLRTGVPRSVYIMDPAVLLLLMGGS